MSAVGVSSSETFSTGVDMYCKGMIQNTFTTKFNFSKAYHLLTLDKFSICLFFLMVDIFNISGAVLIAKQCKYFLVVKFTLHLFALDNFFSFNRLFLINIDVLKKMQFNMMNLLFTCSLSPTSTFPTISSWQLFSTSAGRHYREKTNSKPGHFHSS